MATWRLLWCRIGIVIFTIVLFGGAYILHFVPEAALILGFAFLLAIVGIYQGSRRVVCPNCGKPILMVGINLSHCSKCGSAFESPAPGPPNGQGSA